VIDNGPAWVQYLIAIGTIGAAGAAGWAAWSASRSSSEARDLIQLERNRDARASEDAFWRQVRRLSVELGGSPVVAADGRHAVDFLLAVVNASPDPFFGCRMKVTMGGSTWGPQLVGTLQPGAPAELRARIYSATEDQTDWNAYVRAADANGQYWVVDARGNRAPDPAEEMQTWIDDGRAFAQRVLSAEEWGRLTGVNAVRGPG
jgi:hypothetical protein